VHHSRNVPHIYSIIRRPKQQRSKCGQLIPVRTEQEPNSPFVPTESLADGRVTTWSLARMSISLSVTQVLTMIRVRDQPGHGVSRSERL